MKIDFSKLRKLTKDYQSFNFQKHPEGDLYIFGYSKEKADKLHWDDLSVSCRGLITDKAGNVIARPYKKFWTFRQYLSADYVLLSEERTMRIPNCKFRVLEKVDGSMATLYWLNGIPRLATQRSFTSPKADRATEILHNKYAHTFNRLNPAYTYIFEALYPETRIIVDYTDREDIILTGIIDTETGASLPVEESLGFPVCRDFTNELHGIDNFEDLEKLNLTNQEGFVILFENGERIKIKFPWYQEINKKISRLTMLSKELSALQHDLAKKMNYGVHDLTNLDVWHSLKSGDFELYAIKVKLTELHYRVGIEEWLYSTSHSLRLKFIELKNLSPYLPEEEIWELAKPRHVLKFNARSRQRVEHLYDIPMWNWKNRFLNILS